MKKRDSILIFGAGELQMSLIQNVRDAGFKAIVIDPDLCAPGKQIADVFLTVAPDDFVSTLEIARKHEVKALVTAATDNPMIMMSRVAESLNLRFPSVDSVSTVLDKSRFKKLMQEHSIPCAQGNTYSVSECISNICFDFPVIVKPNKNSGSRGVYKCESYDDLHMAINQTKEFCRDGFFIIEEYIPGDEISVEALVCDGKLNIIQITDKNVSPPPYNVEYGHVQPSKYINRMNEIHEIIQQVVDVTALDNCALHPELKVNDKGVFVIEVGPRLGGDFITSHLVPLSTGVNIEKALINIAIGADPTLVYTSRNSMIKYLSLPLGAVINRPINETSLKCMFPELSLFRLYIREGELASQITSSLDRHGFWIIYGDDMNELVRISNQINSIILDSL